MKYIALISVLLSYTVIEGLLFTYLFETDHSPVLLDMLVYLITLVSPSHEEMIWNQLHTC